MKLRSEFRILKTSPSIDGVLAATILLETGNITRFPGVGHVSSYCRCMESKRISNGKKKVKARRGFVSPGYRVLVRFNGSDRPRCCRSQLLENVSFAPVSVGAHHVSTRDLAVVF
jgi:hypothetical protein